MNRLLQSTGDLPPSTIAAQLVKSLTRGKNYSHHQDHQDRADFENLLRIFETEQDGARQKDTPEEAEECAKLIVVVVKAGLDALLRENPFEGQETIVKQALRSLGVIDVTIKQCPEVLQFHRSHQEADPKLCGPLYLWLVPKLLVVASNRQDQRLRSASATVLHNMVGIERKTRSKELRLLKIYPYVIGCIEGRFSDRQNADIMLRSAEIS